VKSSLLLLISKEEPAYLEDLINTGYRGVGKSVAQPTFLLYINYQLDALVIIYS